MDGFEDTERTRWLEVLAKATSLLALNATKLEDDGLLARAEFLEGLGITRADAAAMLGVKLNTLAAAKYRRTKGGRRGKAQKRK